MMGKRRKLFCAKEEREGLESDWEAGRRKRRELTRGVTTISVWVGISSQSDRSKVSGSLLYRKRKQLNTNRRQRKSGRGQTHATRTIFSLLSAFSILKCRFPSLPFSNSSNVLPVLKNRLAASSVLLEM